MTSTRNENEIIDDFALFNMRVSTEKDFTAKRALVKSYQPLIDNTICHAIRNKTPLDAFTTLDSAKSLVSRELLLQQRWKNAGHSICDATIQHTRPDHVTTFLAKNEDACIIHFYQSPNREFEVLLAYNEGGQAKVERVTLATGEQGQILYRQLVKVGEIDLLDDEEASTRLVFPILRGIGEDIVPRLMKLGSPRRVMLIPHKRLHMLPLHMLLAFIDGKPIFIEEVAATVTYASSLLCYICCGKLHPCAPMPDKKLFLSCVDLQNLGAGAELEVEWYTHFVNDPKQADVATNPSQMPRDLRPYPIFIWSSHGKSDPANWEGSLLSFGAKVIPASHIVQEWNLYNCVVAILSACETGLDRSVDDAIDEYCGLDMALHIAGAQTVISTMWQVEEQMAALVAVLCLEYVLQTRQVSPTLRTIRSLLATGRWHSVLAESCADAKRGPSLTPAKHARLKLMERLLDNREDAFASPFYWGVFRSFGYW